jgi:hypothetical protein
VVPILMGLVPTARAVTIADAGPLVPEDASDRFAKELVRFIAQTHR